ncbi:MAG: hypothetical protein R3F11_21035, partial [Verrucomicrobiales bacterium]
CQPEADGGGIHKCPFLIINSEFATAPLNIFTIEVAGREAPPPAAPLPPGSAGFFVDVTLSQTAKNFIVPITVTSDDPENGVFTSNLIIQTVPQAYFDQIRTIYSDPEDRSLFATPANDGISNILKFFSGIPLGTNSSQTAADKLPKISAEPEGGGGVTVTFEYVVDPEAGLIAIPQMFLPGSGWHSVSESDEDATLSSFLEEDKRRDVWTVEVPSPGGVADQIRALMARFAVTGEPTAR